MTKTTTQSHQHRHAIPTQQMQQRHTKHYPVHSQSTPLTTCPARAWGRGGMGSARTLCNAALHTCRGKCVWCWNKHGTGSAPNPAGCSVARLGHFADEKSHHCPAQLQSEGYNTQPATHFEAGCSMKLCFLETEPDPGQSMATRTSQSHQSRRVIPT